MKKTIKQKLISQIGKFSVVGVLNTTIDVGILNFLVLVLGFKLVISILGFKLLTANLISVALAMVNSYFLNKYWTFRASQKKFLAEVIKFFLITILGMYGIHQLAFSFFNLYWTWPADQIVTLVHFLGIQKIKIDEFLILNFAKGMAIFVSMIWNFIGYKFLVFKK